MRGGTRQEDSVEEEHKGGKVKVIDRRWFTNEGELKEPLSPEDTQARTSTPERAAPSPAAEPPEKPEPTPESAQVELPAEVGLLHLVDFLAQQAMVFLSGQVPGRGRDLEAARFFIDLLAVLKVKTIGRATLEESNHLEDVLYQLRSLYLAATR
jgi:Domain of unknown function (DUF1844)